MKRLRDLGQSLLNDLKTERAAEILDLMEIMLKEEKVTQEQQRVHGDTF